MDDFETSAAFSERERLVLRLAHCLTATPADVNDALFAALKQHFSDKQLVELSSAIAWENYLARSNRLYNIASDNFSQGAFCPMPMHHK